MDIELRGQALPPETTWFRDRAANRFLMGRVFFSGSIFLWGNVVFVFICLIEGGIIAEAAFVAGICHGKALRNIMICQKESLFRDIFSYGIAGLITEKMHDIRTVKENMFGNLVDRKIFADMIVDIIHNIQYHWMYRILRKIAVFFMKDAAVQTDQIFNEFDLLIQSSGRITLLEGSFQVSGNGVQVPGGGFRETDQIRALPPGFLVTVE